MVPLERGRAGGDLPVSGFWREFRGSRPSIRAPGLCSGPPVWPPADAVGQRDSGHANLSPSPGDRFPRESKGNSENRIGSPPFERWEQHASRRETSWSKARYRSATAPGSHRIPWPQTEGRTCRTGWSRKQVAGGLRQSLCPLRKNTATPLGYCFEIRCGRSYRQASADPRGLFEVVPGAAGHSGSFLMFLREKS